MTHRISHAATLGLLLLSGAAIAQTGTPTAKTASAQPAATAKTTTTTDATQPAEDPKAAAQRGKQTAKWMQGRFTMADTDHDGFLTHAEAEKGMPLIARHFDAIDTQHTGKVSLDDIAAYMAKQKPSSEKPGPWPASHYAKPAATPAPATAPTTTPAGH